MSPQETTPIQDPLDREKLQTFRQFKARYPEGKGIPASYKLFCALNACHRFNTAFILARHFLLEEQADYYADIAGRVSDDIDVQEVKVVQEMALAWK